MKKSNLFIVIMAIMVSNLAAQSFVPGDQFGITLDVACFQYDEDSGYLEVYYGFFPSLLTFSWSEKEYHAGAKLWTRIRDEKKDQIIIEDYVLIPMTITDTSDVAFRYPLITQAGYAIPFGDYVMEIVAVDSLNESRQDRIEHKISIDKYSDGLDCSELELCSNIVSSTNEDHPFYKNTLEVVPNPTLVFGVTAYPVLFHYLELYNLDSEKNYTVTSSVVDIDGNIKRQSSKQHNYGAVDAVEVGTMNTTSITSGEYILRIELFDEDSLRVAKTEKTFYVYNPHLTIPTVAIHSFEPSVLSDLSKKELIREFDYAKYLATGEEIRFFKKIEAEDGMRKFLTNFWGEIEKGRMGRSPMKRFDYLQLVEYVDETYREMGREGWKTDRGRIFLIYGNPDEIDRHPSVGTAKPYEIWRHHGIEAGVEFVFIDRFGYGQYILVHSTKRGELRDNTWQRLLR